MGSTKHISGVSAFQVFRAQSCVGVFHMGKRAGVGFPRGCGLLAVVAVGSLHSLLYVDGRLYQFVSCRLRRRILIRGVGGNHIGRGLQI